MADSTSNIDAIPVGVAQKEVIANALFDAFSPGSAFGRRASTTTGLTWGYYGGVVFVSGTPTVIANGTLTLTASATNYIKRSAAGVVSVVTSPPSGWPGPLAAGAFALYEVVTGTAAVTSYTDYRVGLGEQGPSGLNGADGADGADGAGYLATSSTSFTLGTGSQAFTTQAGLAYAAGDRVRVSNDSTHYAEGPVSSYSSTTLTVTVDRIVGTGTFSSWNIGIAGDVGATGAAGAGGLVYALIFGG